MYAGVSGNKMLACNVPATLVTQTINTKQTKLSRPTGLLDPIERAANSLGCNAGDVT
jgi:hypothetical protein